MKYGICVGINQLDRIKIAAECGFDYVEAGFAALTQADDAAYAAFKQALTDNNISCEAANGFLPGTLRVTGDNVDSDAVRAFVEKGMQRAKEVGIQVVVFGSSGARNLDENTSYYKGIQQLIAFLREIAGPVAAKYGVRIAVEPLCPQESNIINGVKEGVILAAAADQENVGGLGDLYHMAIIGDNGDDIRAVKGNLYHTHIASPGLNSGKRRWYPADPAEYDYKDFLDAVEYAGCPRCSVEAGCDDFAVEAPKALAVLRSVHP